MLDGLLPHRARLVGVHAEALELEARVRTTRAEVDPAVREQVEHRGRLGRAHGMVVGARAEAHAVANANVLGARGDCTVEHLGIRAVRVLLEEVVLHRPEGVEAQLVG